MTAHLGDRFTRRVIRFWRGDTAREEYKSIIYDERERLTRTSVGDNYVALCVGFVPSLLLHFEVHCAMGTGTYLSGLGNKFRVYKKTASRWARVCFA